MVLTTLRSWVRRMPSLTVSFWTLLFPSVPDGRMSLLYLFNRLLWRSFSAGGSLPPVHPVRTTRRKATATTNLYGTISPQSMSQCSSNRERYVRFVLLYRVVLVTCTLVLYQKTNILSQLKKMSSVYIIFIHF